MITLWLNQPKYCKYMSDTGSFHSKPRKSPNASFFRTQNPIFRKSRKTEIKREKRRKTCVFRGASFLYTVGGGDEGSRTPVRKSIHTAFFG